jgi:hypothetical protein
MWLDWKHHTWKNSKVKSLTNQTFNDEIEKKSIIQKDPKQKIKINKMKIKIKK